MKIIADIPEYLVNKIRKLISSGKYSTISSFLAASSENQIALEESEEIEEYGLTQNEQTNTFTLSYDIDEKIKKPEKSEFDFDYLPTPGKDELEIYNDNLEKEEWVWGQINRLLPIKIALRILANEQIKKSSLISLDEFRNDASEYARVFGLNLLKKDEEMGRKRDTKMSTGFPIGDNEEKSMSRFSAQFIGYVRRDFRLSGGLPSLRFANIKQDNNEFKIGITKEGFKFAELKNPNIDGDFSNSIFTDDERKFYLDHIRDNVQGEYESFSQILKIIDSGIKGRESINEALKNLAESYNWNENKTNTQRAGAMSRMYELDLIRKVKKGISVEYYITELGKQFIEEH